MDQIAILLIHKIKTMKKAGIAIISGIFFILAAYVNGQNPTHYPPTVNDPVHFTPASIVIFIIIPIAIVVGYYLIRRKKRQKGKMDN
jgi:membrane protein DedA with SNARE-associated domain